MIRVMSETPTAEIDAGALTLPATSRIDLGMDTNTPRMVVTDCCGQLLPESQTLVGDVHFPDLCPACSWLDGREHDRHVTCDWSQGIMCPGPDWTYDAENKRVIPPG